MDMHQQQQPPPRSYDRVKLAFFHASREDVMQSILQCDNPGLETIPLRLPMFTPFLDLDIFSPNSFEDERFLPPYKVL